MKKIVVLMLVLSCGFAALTGCNTWRGAGKDVENTGEKMQKSGK